MAIAIGLSVVFFQIEPSKMAQRYWNYAVVMDLMQSIFTDTKLMQYIAAILIKLL